MKKFEVEVVFGVEAEDADEAVVEVIAMLRDVETLGDEVGVWAVRGWGRPSRPWSVREEAATEVE